VLTPHPLEAARLLGCTTADIQAQRLSAAQRLAHDLMCTVVLKGSGSITAAPNQTPVVNPTGNARLATAGTETCWPA
jgi:NAD(P)H-hydrate repair Nnr-like enzyme with NAD(P)H-hydrate dehydratase domain